MAKVYIELSEFKPWTTQAEETWYAITDNDGLDALEAYIDNLYEGEISETALNDILRFEGDELLADLANYGLVIEGEIEESTRIRKQAVTAAYGGWGKFYGLPDVEFTVPNDTDDPTIFYNGKYYNYYDIEDTLWSFFREYCEETGVIQDEDMFEQWIAENPDYVYEVLENAAPKSKPGRGVYRPESGKLIRSSRRISKQAVMASAWKAPNGKKYGKQTSRFPGRYLFTRSELRKMVQDGIAEDMAGTFNPDTMSYDLIGFSWNDTNGYKSGILIQDRDSGKLYVGNSGDAQLVAW